MSLGSQWGSQVERDQQQEKKYDDLHITGYDGELVINVSWPLWREQHRQSGYENSASRGEDPGEQT